MTRPAEQTGKRLLVVQLSVSDDQKRRFFEAARREGRPFSNWAAYHLDRIATEDRSG